MRRGGGEGERERILLPSSRGSHPTGVCNPTATPRVTPRLGVDSLYGIIIVTALPTGKRDRF